MSYPGQTPAVELNGAIVLANEALIFDTEALVAFKFVALVAFVAFVALVNAEYFG